MMLVEVVASSPTPGVNDDVIGSPTLMSPLETVTWAGTCPVRATRTFVLSKVD